MFMTVRKYENISDTQEATKRVQEGLVPLVAQLSGFVEYRWVDLGQGAMISISVFDTLANATAANQAALVWVRANLTSYMKQNPRVESGKVTVYKGTSKAVLEGRSAATSRHGDKVYR